jgi:hypothetical protein
MAIEGAKIDSAACPAAWAEHVEPWRAGEQSGPDRRRPQHVTAKGELFVPALNDGFGLGARSLVGGVTLWRPALVSSPPGTANDVQAISGPQP